MNLGTLQKPDKRIRVVIIGTISFPYGEASSNRVMGLAKAVKEAGFEPVVIGKELPRECDRTADGEYSVEGIRYMSYGGIKAGSFFEKLRMPAQALERIKEKEGIDLVIVYTSASFPYVPGIIKYCRRSGIPLAADTAEWYRPSTFRYGLLDLRYYLFCIVFRHYLKKIKHMIVTSVLLESFFNKRGVKTLRIPAITDTNNMDVSAARGKKIRLIYAGSPGKKDLLGTAVKSLMLLLESELSCIGFDIFGPGLQTVERLIGGKMPDRLRGVVRVHGKVSVQEVAENLKTSDFSILVRKPNRVTNAGFASKIAESMGHGVPLILTDAGDIKLYLTDGRDCIITGGFSEDGCARAIRRAVGLTETELEDMKKRARETAVKIFDLRRYTKKIKAFVINAYEENGEGRDD